MMQRDSQGCFAPGNTVSKLGWAGLVAKQFNGDERLAKRWLAQLGRFAYASMIPTRARTGMMQYRFETIYRHPGKPAQYRMTMDVTFDLADVAELEF